jgi:hypothetical protein
LEIFPTGILIRYFVKHIYIQILVESWKFIQLTVLSVGNISNLQPVGSYKIPPQFSVVDVFFYCVLCGLICPLVLCDS